MRLCPLQASALASIVEAAATAAAAATTALAVSVARTAAVRTSLVAATRLSSKRAIEREVEVRAAATQVLAQGAAAALAATWVDSLDDHARSEVRGSP